MNNKIQAEGNQFRVMKFIPLQVTWAAGTPSVTWNPENEAVTLTDVGTGDLTITLTDASLIPLKLVGAPAIQVADANTLSLEANIDGAPTTTAVRIVINSGADGATETDPVAIDLTLIKLVVG